ncbi:hypothetical protein T12_1548 [Trichinella patagoniensis]|uniref:Uncharacterized protein n=1 Tax=Trichinella patagoniensis TaxID=990121 RepID=A0A0V0ZVT7_9BILA|nr:hypothetical protein T12_1548 [Trichinella patagoniensis]
METFAVFIQLSADCFLEKQEAQMNDRKRIAMKNGLFIVFPTKHFLLLPNTKTCKLLMVDCFPTKYVYQFFS